MEENTNRPLYFALLGELELHVRYLLEQKWTTQVDVWRAQSELIHFQVKLQDSITAERAIAQELKTELAQITRSKSDGWKPRCQELQEQIAFREERISDSQQALLLSRRLGDAWAWLLLGFDERVIEPLTRNRPVGRTSSGHAMLGMQGIAQAMSNVGAGFPVIHDITDCLRVGDITFVTPGLLPLTMEVKSHLLPLTMEVKSHKEDEKDGAISLRVEAYVVGRPNDADRWRNINFKIPTRSTKSGSPSEQADEMKWPNNTSNPRLSRQLKRMQRARAWQDAVPGEPIEFGEGPKGLLVQATGDNTTNHWDVMQELAAKAKSEGFASKAVDDAFVYMAIYNERSVHATEALGQLPYGKRMVAEAASSGIWLADRTQNRLVIATSLEHLTDRTPLNVIPFFWYPLPLETIVDMLFGRLYFVVLINLGRVVEAFRRVGLDAELPTGEADYRRNFMPVSQRVSLDENTEIRVDLHALGYYAPKLSLEFLSITAFANIAKLLIQAAIEQAAKRYQQNKNDTASIGNQG